MVSAGQLAFFAPQWCFLFLLPWLVHRYFPRAQRGGVALRVPFLPANVVRTKKQGIPFWVVCVLQGGLVLCAMKPHWRVSTAPSNRAHHDWLLAVDLSSSMQTPDVQINAQEHSRLDGVKFWLHRLLEAHPGDRFGLLVFGTQAYMEVPLTYDHASVDYFVDEMAVGMLGEKTALGDAIAKGVDRLVHQPSDERILLLLTDGVSNAGTHAKEAALRAAQQRGVELHVVGVGTGQVREFQWQGQAVTSTPLADAELKALARDTGGHYFSASNEKDFDSLSAWMSNRHGHSGIRRMGQWQDLSPWVLLLVLVIWSGVMLNVCWSRR